MIVKGLYALFITTSSLLRAMKSYPFIWEEKFAPGGGKTRVQNKKRVDLY